MKKWFMIALACLFLLPLCSFFASAASPVTHYAVFLEYPIDGALPAEPTVLISVAGSDTALREEDGDYTLSCSWFEEKAGKSFSGSFVGGKTYLLVISVADLNDAYEFHSTPTLSVNGTVFPEAILAKKGDAMEITLPFLAEPEDITPAVTLTAEGEIDKVYDGKTAYLTVKVSPAYPGIVYDYHWLCDGKDVITDENLARLPIRNVADSGKYTCLVVATSPTKSAVSLSLEMKVDIRPRALTLVLESAEKTLGDPDPVFTYSLLGETFDEISGEIERASGEDVGEYTLLPGTLSFGDVITENYQLQILSGHLSILSPGKITFASVGNVADLSRIVGKSSSHIRVSASKGAIPEGAILSIAAASDDDASRIQNGAERPLLKAVTLSLIKENGDSAALTRGARLRIQIPLTEEEEKQDAKTMKVLLFTGGEVQELPFEIKTLSDVTYLSFDTESIGTLALVSGETPAEHAPEDGEPKGEKNLGAGLWAAIIAVCVIAVGAIAAGVFFLIKNKPKTPPKAPNAKPDKKAKPQKMPKAPKTAETEPGVDPLPDDERPDLPDEGENNGSKTDNATRDKDTAAVGKVISFEDLEE